MKNKAIIGKLMTVINTLVRKQVIPAQTAAEMMKDFNRSVKGREVVQDDLENVIMMLYAADISFEKYGEIEDAETRIRKLLQEDA